MNHEDDANRRAGVEGPDPRLPIHEDVARELEFHLEMRARELMEAGSRPEEARREARRRFGDLRAIARQCRDISRSHVRRRTMRQTLDNLWQDVRFGLRTLGKKPAFTLVAVLTLALGIGANTAIFSVVNGVLLQPLGYPQADELVVLTWRWGPAPTGAGFSAFKYFFWKEHSRSFEGMAATRWGDSGFNLADDVEPVRLRGKLVSHDFFDVVGVEPMLGREFVPEEDAPGGPLVVVLSHALWQERFGRDPDVIGRTVRLDERVYEVVGVMPADVPEVPNAADLWSPLRLEPDPTRQNHDYPLVARLRDDVTLEQAREEMELLYERFAEAHPGLASPDREFGVGMVTMHEMFVGSSRTPLLVLFGAVGLVLLIACANVANLLLARATERRREIAVRAALGASRRRILVQLLVEAVLLAAAAAALGILLTRWGLDALLAMSPGALPRSGQVGIDPWVLAFTSALAVATGVVFGLAAAARLFRGDLGETLKEGGREEAAAGGRRRVRNVLVVAEAALSVMLLVGAGLLIASFLRLQAVDPGFEPQGLLTGQLPLAEETYDEAAAIDRLSRRLVEELSAAPGVEGVATMAGLPFVGALNHGIELLGREEPRSGYIEFRAVSPGYFEILGIPILRGRPLEERDDAGGARVALVNETAARRYWGEDSPIGTQVSSGGGPPRTIVGVAGDVRDKGLDWNVQPTIYVPHVQVDDGLTAYTYGNFPLGVVLRSSAPERLAPTLREIVRDIDPGQPVVDVRPMDEVISSSVATQRFQMRLMGIFAALALILTVVGVYGVLSYTVSQRSHEVGVRMALGASRASVLRMVLGDGMKMVGLGLVLGILGALALTRVLESMVYETSVTDPLTFLAVVPVVLGVAALACYLPARRATRVDPILALRDE